MDKVYEHCYILREIMIHDCKKKISLLDKIKFKIINYLASKY